MYKNETRLKSLTMHKGTFKIDQDLNPRPETDRKWTSQAKDSNS